MTKNTEPTSSNARQDTGTNVPNQQNAQWSFNGDVNKPTFEPSVKERTGYYVSPDLYKKDDQYSYQCHFNITEGKIIFHNDCSHGLKGQTLNLPDIEEMK